MWQEPKTDWTASDVVSKVDIIDTFAKYIPYLVLVGMGYLILNIDKIIK